MSLLGGCSRLLLGRYASSLLTCLMQSMSSLATKCADPERLAWTLAPPSSSKVTVSFWTALMTSGPTMNMKDLSLTMNTKSLRIGA